MKNLIAKIPKIEVLPQTKKINYLDLLSKTKKEEEPKGEYGYLRKDLESIRVDLSLYLKKEIKLEKPLSDEQMRYLDREGCLTLLSEKLIIYKYNDKKTFRRAFLNLIMFSDKKWLDYKFDTFIYKSGIPYSKSSDIIKNCEKIIDYLISEDVYPYDISQDSFCYLDYTFLQI